MPNKMSVYVIGCGGHAKVVLNVVQQLGHDVAAIFDDDARKCGQPLRGIPVVGPIEKIADYPRLPTVIAVGDNCIRERIASRFEFDWATLVHPFAYVDPTVTLGPGTVVFAGAVVQADTVLGEHVIINTGASVDHDCRVGRFAHIAPGVRLAGAVQVGDKTLIGIGAVVIPERRVGSNCIVGAGAVVTQNIPDGVTAVGMPARVRKFEG